MFYINRVPSIKIGLDPWLYRFHGNSGTGKTYLAVLLNKYRTYGDPVAAFTYDDFKLGRKLIDMAKIPWDVIMVDRYDLYEQPGALDMLCLSHPNSVVLVESKMGIATEIDYLTAKIKIKQEELEVYC